MLLANIRDLDAIRVQAAGEPLAAFRVAARLDFSHFGAGPPPPPRADGPAATDPLDRLISADADRFAPADWAEVALRALEGSGGTALGAGQGSLAGYQLANILIEMASDQRRWGRLDLAGRTADRILALTQVLVERTPDDPHAHLLLADAYQQINKNAWQSNDRAAVVSNLERAIAATQRALVIDPSSEVAWHAIDRRRRKLKGLLTPVRQVKTPFRPTQDLGRVREPPSDRARGEGQPPAHGSGTRSSLS